MTIFMHIIAVIFLIWGIYHNTKMLNDWTDKNTGMIARCYVAIMGTIGYLSTVIWIGLILTYFFGGVTVR